MADALGGIRILDLCSSFAGALGVLPLAEHGAEVIKVEPPGGDPFRRYPGSHALNRSRRSVIIDLGTPEGQRAFAALASTADVVVDSGRPGDFAAIDRVALRRRNPGLIWVSCPAYPAGHRLADRPGWDALVQASSGIMWEQPGWRLGPTFLHLPIPSVAAAPLVSAVILAALVERERSGLGQDASTSLFQGALSYTTQMWQEVERAGRAYHEMMAKNYPPGIHQTFAYECAGGEWMHVSILSGLTPRKTIDEVVGFTPTDFATADAGRRAAMRSWDRAELVDALRAANHACEAITPAADILSHIQTVANGTVATVDDPVLGSLTQMGVPIHLATTPGRITGPQPVPGADDLAALTRAAPPARPVAPRDQSPLSGITVLDVGQYLAGPFAPMILGDLGADVIKLEPITGDAMRGTPKAFIGCQRGKRSIAVDLKNPDGLEIALRLAAQSDIVHHNMTRGVATRLGLDYPACRTRRADVIYCNTYAYGLDDPLGRFGGLDPIFQASSGIEYEAGAMPAGGKPLYMRFGQCDISNAMLSLIGVLLALVHRARTGEGQELWTSLHDGGIVLSSDVWVGPDGQPWDRPHLDAGQRGLGPGYRIYRTLDEGWMCVAANGTEQFARLCEAVGTDSTGLEAAFATRTTRMWHVILDEAGVPNEPVLDTFEGRTILHDNDNIRLGLVVEHEHPTLGKLRQFGRLFSFSETRGPALTPPPLVGQHTREVLHTVGYRDGDVDSLISSGVVYEPDDTYRWVT